MKGRRNEGKRWKGRFRWLIRNIKECFFWSRGRVERQDVIEETRNENPSTIFLSFPLKIMVHGVPDEEGGGSGERMTKIISDNASEKKTDIGNGL